jgi:hypothetical protein
VTDLKLTRKDIRILLQSLDNCLTTCKTHAKNADAPCEDCDSARKLQKKLKKQLPV